MRSTEDGAVFPEIQEIQKCYEQNIPVKTTDLCNLYIRWLNFFFDWGERTSTKWLSLRSCLCPKITSEKRKIEAQQQEEQIPNFTKDTILNLYHQLLKIGRDQTFEQVQLTVHFAPFHVGNTLNYECPHCQARVLFALLRRCIQQHVREHPEQIPSFWQNQESQTVVLLSADAIAKVRSSEILINHELEQALRALGHVGNVILMVKPNSEWCTNSSLAKMVVELNRHGMYASLVSDVVTPYSPEYCPKIHINRCSAHFMETTGAVAGDLQPATLNELFIFVNSFFWDKKVRYIWIDNQPESMAELVGLGRGCCRVVTPVLVPQEKKSTERYIQELQIMPSWLVKDHGRVAAGEFLPSGKHTYLVSRSTTKGKGDENKNWYHKGEADTRQHNSRVAIGSVIDENVLGCRKCHLELLFYSLYKMLLPPNTCPYRSKLTTQDGRYTEVLSREIPEFKSFTELAANQGFWTGLDQAIVMLQCIPIWAISFCLGEMDLNCGNVGFAKNNRVCRIDFESSVTITRYFCGCNWKQPLWSWGKSKYQPVKTLANLHEGQKTNIKRMQSAAVAADTRKMLEAIQHNIGFWISWNSVNASNAPFDFLLIPEGEDHRMRQYMWQCILKYLLLTPDMLQYFVQLLIPTAQAQTNIFTELLFQYELIKEVFMPTLRTNEQLQEFLGAEGAQGTILWEFAQYNLDPSIGRHPQLQIPLAKIWNNFSTLFPEAAAAGCPPL